MPDFSVNVNVIRLDANKAAQAKKTLNTQSYEISRIRSRLFGVSMIPIRVHLLKKTVDIRMQARRMATLSTALQKTVKIYEAAENHILQYGGTRNNPAFSGRQGQYGGRQAGPSQNADQMVDIVRKYHPNWSREKINQYLSTLNSEGCGYVALTNTIYLIYSGREEEFERTFGFPMRDENGNLNYNALITDFYTSKDNPFTSGTNRWSQEKMWESYCRDHGIKVDVKDINVNAQTYKEIAKNGQIIVGVHPVNLYKRRADGSYYQVDDRDAGHAMTITGVTDDGRFIVSSWGETYYLDSDLSGYSRCEFQQVIYE